MSTPFLTLKEVRENDPNSQGKRFLCPLPDCQDHQGAGHRSLSVDESTGLFYCFRCGYGGQLREFWKPLPKLTARQRSMAAARKAFG